MKIISFYDPFLDRHNIRLMVDGSRNLRTVQSWRRLKQIKQMIQHKKRKDDGSYFYSHLLCLPREKVGLQCLCTKVTLKIGFIHTTAIKPVCYVSSRSSMMEARNTCKNVFEKEAFCNVEPRRCRQKENFASWSALEFLQSPIQKRRHVCPNL